LQQFYYDNIVKTLICSTDLYDFTQ
jgi:hypothetical protein